MGHSEGRSLFLYWQQRVPIRNINPCGFKHTSAADRAGQAWSLPAKHDTPPHEPRTERGKDHQVAGGETAAADALVQRDRDRGRRRVPLPLDVVVDLVVSEAQLLLHRLGDPEVGLV